MRLVGVLGKGVEDLGFRFLFIGLLPSTFFMLFLMALLWSGAPATSPDAEKVFQKFTTLETEDAVLFSFAIVLVTLVLQPLQSGMFRFMEGYWGDGKLAKILQKPLIKSWKRKRNQLLEKSQTNSIEDLSSERRREMESAGMKLRYYFPEEDRLMPTSLGNVLRCAEDLAGNRYGLDTVTMWPRLYPSLPKGFKVLLEDKRNQLDFNVRMCYLFALSALISVVLLFKFGWWIVVPFVFLIFALISYKNAISTSLDYGILIQTAFDLHRFDLLQALRLPLPRNYEEEVQFNKKLSNFLRQGFIKTEFEYDHKGAKKSEEAKE